MHLPRLLGALRFFGAWLVPWKPVFRARVGGSDLRFFVHRRDVIGRHIAKYGTHEPLLTRWINDYLTVAPSGIVIDVGANLGWHALHCAKHNSVEAVLAFEPDPFNASLFDRNRIENGMDKVILDIRAIGAKSGIVRLYQYKNSNRGRHTVLIDQGYGSIDVKMIKLDNALDELGFGQKPISLVKIDVEGLEPEVIAGAGATLSRAVALIIEHSPNLSLGASLSPREMLTRLNKLGFAPFVLRREGGATPTSIDELQNFDGSIDLVWLRSDRVTPKIVSVTNSCAPRALTLSQIAEQNKLIVKMKNVRGSGTRKTR